MRQFKVYSRKQFSGWGGVNSFFLWIESLNALNCFFRCKIFFLLAKGIQSIRSLVHHTQIKCVKKISSDVIFNHSVIFLPTQIAVLSLTYWTEILACVSCRYVAHLS